MNSTVKTVLFWLLIGVSAPAALGSGQEWDGQNDQEQSVTQFMGDFDQNSIRDMEVNGMEVFGHHRDRSQFHTNFFYSLRSMRRAVVARTQIYRMDFRKPQQTRLVIAASALGYRWQVGGMETARHSA